VNVGGIGGVFHTGLGSSIKKNASPKKNINRIAGRTTLVDESDQKFVEVPGFPTDPSLAVTLNLRLVARENEAKIPPTGKATPLASATLIPPPLQN
jgi:hypothetical protein